MQGKIRGIQHELEAEKCYYTMMIIILSLPGLAIYGQDDSHIQLSAK